MMVVLAAMVLGAVSMNRLPVDLFPEVDIPYVSVVTIYPGASPSEIESQIADELEEEFTSLSDLESMKSDSLESVSFIILEFSTEADLEEKAADVRDKVEAIKNQLPEDAEDPKVLKFDIGSFPIMFAAISAPRSLSEVRKTADDIVKPYMERIPGIASVGISGGLEREIHVNVNRDKLYGYNLSILQVVEALAKDNLDIPAGRIKRGTDESLVRVLGEYGSVEEIGDVNIVSPMGIVKIRDIADVQDSFKDVKTYSRLNGENAVSLQIIKQSDANTVAVSQHAKEAMKELSGKSVELDKKEDEKQQEVEGLLPDDYQIAIAMDMSKFIVDALRDVKTNLIYGCIFATLMVLLFLRDSRSTFIVFLAIPISIISTFMPVYAAGFSINFMSLMGLALAVGTLVDNSIVVLENIFRHLEKGKSPMDAARDGVKEVGLAVIVSGTTNVCVYMSVAFMSGMIGSFFREFGLTIAFATMFSIFTAFTLTPALSSRIFKPIVDSNGNHLNNGGNGLATKILTYIFFPVVIVFKYIIFPAFDFLFNGIQKRYPSILGFCIRVRWVPVTVVVILLVSAGMVAKQIPQEFVPQADQGELYVLYEMPAYASLDDTNRVAKQVEDMLSEIPEVSVYSTTVGEKIGRGSTEEQSDPRYGWTTVRLVSLKQRDKSTEDIVKLLRGKVADIPDATFQVSQSSMGGPPGELPMMIDVNGPDRDTLIRVAEEVEKIVKNTPGALDVSSSWAGGKAEIQIYPDKEKMASMGVDIATLGYTVRTSLEGDDSVQFSENGEEYDIRVRFDEEERADVRDVCNIPIMTPNGSVKLSNLADVKQELGPVTLTRKNGEPSIRIQGNLGDKTIAEVIKSVDEQLKEKDILPSGYTVDYEGHYSEMEEMGKEMGLAIGLAILFVFMVMAAQFESLLYPFVVMFTLPLTFIGVAWSLFLSGRTLNMMTQIAIVMLIGIVVNNGILLVDFINQRRGWGMARNNAIMRAGVVRLRPILITSFSTMSAMLPSAIFAGSGGGFRTPMAIVAIGGMLVSTFLTLVFIPVMYTLIDDLPRLFQRIFMGKKLEPVWDEDGDVTGLSGIEQFRGDEY